MAPALIGTTADGLSAGSVGLIVGVAAAALAFLAFFVFVAYCFPFARCYLACSPCVNVPCLNCIVCYYVCCPCLEACLERRQDKRIYIQDMLATPDGKIIHMSNVGRVLTP